MSGNETSTFERIKETVSHEMFILYSVTLAFVLVTNSMLIYGFHKTSRPFTIVTKLFIYLSISEVAMVTCIFADSIVLNSKTYSILKLITSNLFISTFMYNDILVFWTISSLRLLSIYKPMCRVKTRTITRILVVELLTSFSFTATLSGIYIALELKFDSVIELMKNLRLGTFLVTILINLSLNMSSLILLRRSTNLKAQEATDNVSNNTMVIKQKKKATTTLLFITIFQLICNLPITCINFIKMEHQGENHSA